MRATIASILLLIGIVSVAHAECAWALWINPFLTSTGWRLVSGVPAGFASKADCESTATYRDGGKSSQPGDVMCLPQGVQPTGKVGSYEYGPWRGGK
jgi:hypothetical protein